MAGLLYAAGMGCPTSAQTASPSVNQPGKNAAEAAGDQRNMIPTESLIAKQMARYTGEPTVIERNDRESIVAANGTGSEHQAIVVRVQTEAAVKDLSVLSFSFAGESQHVDLDYVRVRHPDGSVVETPVSEALEMPSEVMRQAPFYSDMKLKQIPVRGLRPGDRLEWSVRLIRTKPEAPGRFWGVSAFTGKEHVAISETFSLRIPKSKNSQVWSPKLQPAEITEQNGDRVYRWSSSQLEATVGSEAETRADVERKRVLTPDEITDRTEGALPAIAWTNFPDWPSVGAWYRNLESDRRTPDEAVGKKAAELTSGKATDEEKISALYAYVATEIRYIGVALGQGRYQPHLASEVQRNQYGDCKDKATLLAALLAASGYRADVVLIGPGIRFNKDVPSPGAFNHAINAVSLGSVATARTIWLDSTLEVAPFQVLAAAERDKPALRVPVDGPARLDRTPPELPFASFQHFQSDGILDGNGLVKGRLSYTFRGDDELALRAVVRQLSQAQYDGAAQYLLANMGFGGKVSHASFSAPDRTREPFVMSFDYERDKPGNDWGNYRIISLEGSDGLPTLDEKDPPQLPLDLGIPRTMTTTSRTALPPGWSASVPEAVHEHTPWVRFDRTYRVDHGTLIEDKTIEVLQQQVPVGSWRDYKKFADAVSPGTFPYVQLTRAASTGNATPGPPPPSNDNAEAGRLVQQAAKANEQRQIAQAGDLIEQAKALNEQQPYLWSVAGYQAMLRGETTEAVNDFKREVDLHPNEEQTYPLLATGQIAQGKRTEAEATLHRRLEVIGPNAPIATQLTEMLLEDGNASEALSVAEEARKADPSNKRLLWLLGRTRMKAGQKAAGLSTLSATLRETEDSELRNDIAYELADNGYATAEIEAASREVVRKLTAETATWNLTTADQDIAEMRRNSNLLVAAWDTLGWTIFRSATGKEPLRLAEAECYLAAAWQNNLRADVGLHLGDVQEARHHAASALTTYQLAEAASPHFDVRGVHQPPTPIQRELAQKIKRLKKAQPRAVSKEPGEAFSQLSKLPAGASNGQSLVVPYRMLLGGDGVLSAVATETTDGDHGKPDLVRDLARLRKAVPPTWVPAGSSARLLRSGVLNCHQAICEVLVNSVSSTR